MKKKVSLLLVFFISFLDLLGISIIIPVLAPMFLGDTTLLPASADFGTRSIVIGFLLSVYPIAQFFGAPLLGRWSDKIGRKPVIMIAFAGTMIANILVAYGIMQGWLVLLFFARFLDGFTGGNVSVINSIIADVSSDTDKSKNFGLVGMAFGLSFVIGPFFGGQLSDASLVSWFNYATPFWFAAGLSLLTILIVWLRLPETLKRKNGKSFSLTSGIVSIIHALKKNHLRPVLITIFALALGFTFFTVFYQVILVEKFAFTPKNIGYFFAYVGIWIALTQGVANPFLSKRFKPRHILPFSIFGLIISFLILLFIDNTIWLYVLAPMVAISQGLTQPNIITTLSRKVAASEQGEFLGINQSLTSLAITIAPIVAGFLSALHITLPLLAAAVVTAIAWIMYMRFRSTFS